jgi:hypothetical protein
MRIGIIVTGMAGRPAPRRSATRVTMPLCSTRAAGPVAVCLPVASTRRWVMLRSIKAR